RGTSCEFRIENDLISRRHAKVYFEDGSWWICDHNSTNGIYLEDQQVHEVKIDNE
ncbi:MAG: FHA domain-containing protein, partial [Aliifodinibius sp.]|nr:FHA domain-containing protein [Nitrosopumilaceae archaeon]NIV12554.1 FHA domain-containing protein [Fodinibius sp.]NIX61349.1 FHA domain-containing protein [Nitrosopumilaceae archaeon]